MMLPNFVANIQQNPFCNNFFSFLFSNISVLFSNKEPLLKNNLPLLSNTCPLPNAKCQIRKNMLHIINIITTPSRLFGVWHHELLREHLLCGSVFVLNDIHTFLKIICLFVVDSVNMFYHIGLVSRQHTDAVFFFS